MVELSTSHGANYPVVSAKARQNLLSVIEEAVNMDLCNPVERRCVAQIAMKLHHVWGGKDTTSLSLSTH